MLRYPKCEKCGTELHGGILSGYAHIKCKHCQSKYQLTQRSMKLYMFIPLIAVALAVGLSILFLKNATIDIKTIFILGLSFMIVYIAGMLLVHAHILEYEYQRDDER